MEIVKEQEKTKASRELRYEIMGDAVVFHSERPWKWAELMDIADKIRPKSADISEAIKRRQIVK